MEPEYVTKDDLKRLECVLKDLRTKADVTLRDYVDARFLAVSEATTRARESMERRLEGMNEFRETLRDQSNKYILGDECKAIRQKYDERNEHIEGTIKSLELTRAAVEGKASRTAAIIASVLGSMGIIIGLISIIIELIRR